MQLVEGGKARGTPSKGSASCVLLPLAFQLFLLSITSTFSNSTFAKALLTTFSDRCLGSSNDEGRSEV